jgi:hypothetical protein
MMGSLDWAVSYRAGAFKPASPVLGCNQRSGKVFDPSDWVRCMYWCAATGSILHLGYPFDTLVLSSFVPMTVSARPQEKPP